MTYDEVIEECSTEEGCLKYIKERVNSNQGFYNWCYLPKDKVPVLNSLLTDGKVATRINNGVDEWRVI